MERIKQFALYILIIIVFYLFVSLASYSFINKTYKNINEYEILTKSPKIEILEKK